jgi:acyl-CoA thioesterase
MGSAKAEDADALARRCAEAMWADDTATQALGMEIVEVGAGRAVMAMTVAPAMVNGHGLGHGGYIFTLADSAFAFACNSYNQRSVAQHCSITYIAAARLGDRLTARAVERSRAGRSGIYDVTVTREDGTVIAEFRGHSRTIEGTLV